MTKKADEKRVLLICTAGITSGLLVKSVQLAADEENLNLHVYSAPAIIAEQAVQTQDIDALLIGSQSEYEVARLKDFLMYKAVPYRIISPEAYETLDGKKVLQDIKGLLKLS